MQAGTVAFCGVTAATMAHNGGKHAWDITPAQAHEAIYVRPAAFSKENIADADWPWSGSMPRPSLMVLRYVLRSLQCSGFIAEFSVLVIGVLSTSASWLWLV